MDSTTILLFVAGLAFVPVVALILALQGKLKEQELRLPDPTVEEAFKRAQAMVDAYQDWTFYVAQIKGLDLREERELVKYLEKADYGLTSVRDEIQIIYNRAEKQRQLDAINARVARENQRHVG